MAPPIRPAVLADAAAILDIYRPYVLETPVTLEITPPAPDAFARRMADILGKYPYLVCGEDERIDGYAYATVHNPREGYRYNVLTSVYLRHECAGRGLGGLLYSRLLEILRIQGFCTAYAIVTVPNTASLALHRKLGFREDVVFHRSGYKFGRWHDVAWLEKRLRDEPNPSGKLLGPEEAFLLAASRDGKAPE